MAKQESKRHHFVPESYLKAWCRDGVLQMYTNWKGKITVRNKTPGQVGYRFGLYEMLSSSIENKAILEDDYFQKLDSRAIPIIRNLSNDMSSSVSREERYHLARFALSLRVRNPWGIEKVTDIVRYTAEAYLSSTEDAKRIGLPTGESMLSILQRNPHYQRDSGIIKMVQSHGDPMIVNRLMNFDWQVWNTDQFPLELIVGDRPLLLRGDLSNPAQRTWVSLPLSPTKLLVMLNYPLVPRVTLNTVRQHNRLQAEEAAEHFFTSTRTYHDLAKARLREYGPYEVEGNLYEAMRRALEEGKGRYPYPPNWEKLAQPGAKLKTHQKAAPKASE